MKTMKIVLATLVLITLSAQIAFAQLHSETRKVFDEIIPELDTDLGKLFLNAIKKNSATVEFTPGQFKRFRSSPYNPFEGLDNIDAESLDGNIALKFELPTVRNRNTGNLERQHADCLKCFETSVATIKTSIVKILINGKQVALGTILTQDGYILTKASEITKDSEIVCQLSDGTKKNAELMGSEKRNDLAILKISRKGLKPANFTQTQTDLGAFVITPDNKKAIALGVYSTHPRSLLSKNPAYLGVRPVNSSDGVKVETVTSMGSAESAGIRAGDIITKIDGRELTDVTQLVTRIRQLGPGDKLQIEYKRDGKLAETVAKLNGRTLAQQPGPPRTQQHGAELSRRHDNFPFVFQHDSPLLPEQCGGPLIDIDGNVIGINIARHGRIGCYAIPAAHAKTVIDSLLRRDVASK